MVFPPVEGLLASGVEGHKIQPSSGLPAAPSPMLCTGPSTQRGQASRGLRWLGRTADHHLALFSANPGFMENGGGCAWLVQRQTTPWRKRPVEGQWSRGNIYWTSRKATDKYQKRIRITEASPAKTAQRPPAPNRILASEVDHGERRRWV